MEVDSGSETLRKIAAGGSVEEGTWPTVRADIIARLNKIVRNDFPIPNLPPPTPAPPTLDNSLLSPVPSSPTEHTASHEADKENNAAYKPADPSSLAPGELPKQVLDALGDIKTHLETFADHAPHTIQRLGELILEPRAHYRALTSYLHAVDRVARVTSSTNVYPLPPAIPDMSTMGLNGDEKDPASSVSWSNPAVATLGTDEALGGALLTPIPWLTRRSPEGNGDAPASAGAQIHSESTETIEGPNGMGRIETVSVSVNGIPSTGHARGVTQGELLRQEQRAGVVPVSQLNRNQESLNEDNKDMDTEEDGVPHARGPEEIGVGDTGPQGVTTSYIGEDGVLMQGIDVEAAVGRKQDDDYEHGQQYTRSRDDDAGSTSSTESAGTKREAEHELESEPAKKVKEDNCDSQDVVLEEASAEAAEEATRLEAADPVVEENAPAGSEAEKESKESEDASSIKAEASA
ncbi:Protein phosphatase 4 core regulatory subunit R2 [Metarhizium album ARSEF 1941]|uniref:Protein phosphatase 4 core regulatory subunit R2 n=1 Tax=Metarhizium album (strain ARSEF 1941) TaxID=1081103 RepID=A0A0B2X1D5_METAS|nr:Protein phosphatase 4 core regulatory subunit R2 [Metarhizium album ARSEF 1941]KHN98890.1 Protein phosphatase 4 core regulatory subunit R2 [Metarhizium album ARSEF 1941]